MSRLDIENRVYGTNTVTGEEWPVVCAWFAKCTNPANGLRDHPVLDQVPICVRCDDRVEEMSK